MGLTAAYSTRFLYLINIAPKLSSKNKISKESTFVIATGIGILSVPALVGAMIVSSGVFFSFNRTMLPLSFKFSLFTLLIVGFILGPTVKELLPIKGLPLMLVVFNLRNLALLSGAGLTHPFLKSSAVLRRLVDGLWTPNTTSSPVL